MINVMFRCDSELEDVEEANIGLIKYYQADTSKLQTVD
jgi:hypothetical protein